MKFGVGDFNHVSTSNDNNASKQRAKPLSEDGDFYNNER
jgi:hypothetical protein